MSDAKTEAEIIQWAVRRSRGRAHKSYPWHELQEIALAIEHGLDEQAAFAQAEAADEPLSQTLPSSLRKKHDEPRVAQLRALITTTNWAQAEREYDEARRQALLRPPVAPPPPIVPEPAAVPEPAVAPTPDVALVPEVTPEPTDPGTRS